ncbi:MAG TPA: hypothetical protein PLA96_10470 [Candidatus Brocadia sapporoensis]|jgi:hypothetical protein|nr:hypothetical protein [Candidatus Brocadia sapporoensis]HQU31905.1 hypothetical protein [Candidatus Brocadia sapporoensis]
MLVLLGGLHEEIIKTGDPVIVRGTETSRFCADGVLFKEEIR